jgi:sRNA-binding regulator protein Hfq
MQGTERKESYPQIGNARKPDDRQRDPSQNRYSVLDCFSKKDVGKSVTMTLINGRVESGILKDIGMFDIKLELSNKKELILFKHALVSVSIL